MNWKLSEAQMLELAPFVQGCDVMDLGAADLRGSKLMLELGASSVLAVDRNPMPKPEDSRISTEMNLFHNVREVRPVVLASWIVNWPVGIEVLLAPATLVVSISKNTDGTACGYPEMWDHLSHREVLAHVPERRNTLTVYGPQRVSHRPLTGEELAALWPDTMRMWSFEEAEAHAKAPVG